MRSAQRRQLITQSTESDWTPHRKVWLTLMRGPIEAHILSTTSTCVSLSALSPQLSNWHDATVCNKKHFSIKTEWVFFECAVSDTNGDAVKRPIRSLLSRVTIPSCKIPNAQIGAFGDIPSVCFQYIYMYSSWATQIDSEYIPSPVSLSLLFVCMWWAWLPPFPDQHTFSSSRCCSIKPSLLPQD